MVDIVPLFKALADEKRIKIAALLSDRPLSVEDLAAALELPARVVGRHLVVLMGAGLVEAAHRGHATVYYFRQEPLFAALRGLAEEPQREDFDGDLDEFDQKVLKTFFEGGRLKSIPAQQKKRDVVLRYLVDRFETGRLYSEKEVNAILATYHDDVASLRRYMVDGRLLERQIVRVVETEALLAGTAEVEHRITYWKPEPEVRDAPSIPSL